MTCAEEVAAQVEAYFADCARFRLDPAYHPTIESAFKVVFCPSDAAKAAARDAFDRMTRNPGDGKQPGAPQKEQQVITGPDRTAESRG